MYNGIEIAVVIYSVHVYNNYDLGEWSLLCRCMLYMYMVYVLVVSVHTFVCMCVCVCVYTCLCKPQHSLAEHHTHCMYKPRLRASDRFLWRLLLARTPQSIAT